MTPSPHSSARGQDEPLWICACRSGEDMARRIARLCRSRTGDEPLVGSDPLEGVDYQFSDGETCVRLETSPEGKDVFVVQAWQDARRPSGVDANGMALLCAVRAAREWGARRVVGVLPYLAYARQDKPTRDCMEPTTARLLADLLAEAGMDRLVTFAPHMETVRGFYRFPVTVIRSVDLFAEVFEPFRERSEVIAVAPDLGASRWVAAFARKLRISSAVASKRRPKPEAAAVETLIGDFSGKRVALLMDDMVGTGGTLQAVADLLVADKGIEAIHVGVSHHLGLPQANERLEALHGAGVLREFVLTNSIPQPDVFLAAPYVRQVDIAGLLAEAILGIHHQGSR